MNRFLKLFLFFISCLPTVRGLAQVDTVFGCVNSVVTLDGPSGFTSYTWQPPDGLRQTIGSRVVAEVTQDRLYTVSSVTMIGPNLISNPEFENGNTAFTSDYVLAPQGSTAQGTYAILNSPRDFNIAFADCPDTVTPNGFMLVADGATGPNTDIWCQQITVEPGERYVFNFFFTSIVSDSPARFTASFNGVQVGGVNPSESQTCVWRQLNRVWDSGNATSVEVCISNQNLSAPGNDFAIDRISLFKLSPPRIDSIYLRAIQPSSGSEVVGLCPGERYTENGLNLGVGESGTTIITAANGCDSILMITTVQNDSIIQNARIDSLCPGETYVFNGITLDRDTTICQTFSSTTRCDSIFCLTLKYFDEEALEITSAAPLCSGTLGGSISVTPTAGRPPFSYQWDDGANGPTRSNLEPGNFVVTVTDANGCSASSSIELQRPTPIQIREVVTLPVRCNGESTGLILVNTTGGTGEITTTITSNGVQFPFDELPLGTFQIVVSDESGCTVDTFATIGGPNPVFAQLTGDSLVRLGFEASYQGSVFGDNVSESWTFNGIAIDSLVSNGMLTWRPPGEGLLSLVATDENGCEDIASIFVRKQTTDTPFFPNAFSPNEDGINDSFGPYPEPAFVLLEEFAVFDRWGNQYYTVTDCPLDGTTNCFWTGRTEEGKQADAGIYAYYAKIRLIDDSVLLLTGDVLLAFTIRN